MNYYAEDIFSKEITSHSADRLFSLMIYELELTGETITAGLLINLFSLVLSLK